MHLLTLSLVVGTSEESPEEIVGLKIEVNREAEIRILVEEQLEKVEETNAELTQQLTDQKKDFEQQEAHLKEHIEAMQTQLNSTTDELTRLKGTITALVGSIVGKPQSSNIIILPQLFSSQPDPVNISVSGPRDGTLRKTTTDKVKCLYRLVRQLYFGSCEVIKTVCNWDNPPNTYHDVLGHLSTMPQWIEMVK